MKMLQQKWFVITAIAFMLFLAGLVMSGTALSAGGSDPRCVDNGDGTVTDNAEGLMWQKATAGPMNWHDAMSYASSLSLAGHSDWKLPYSTQLNHLYHSPCKDMMDVNRGYYWASHLFTASLNRKWVYNFSDGGAFGRCRTDSHYVRARRPAQ